MIIRNKKGEIIFNGRFTHAKKLRGAQLRESEGIKNFERCNLSKADLSFAELDGSDLGESNLSGANLRSASLEGCDMECAD